MRVGAHCPRSFHRWSRRWARARAELLRATTVGLPLIVLAAGLHAPAQAAPQEKTWTAREEKSVSGATAPVKPRKPDPAEQKAVKGTPPVNWPKSGTAEVTLSRPDAAKNADRTQAGGLPVRVGPTQTAVKEAETRGEPTVDTPGKVRVEVLGRRDEALLLRVNRSDGQQRAGQVSLEVNYADFQHAYGGDWASRLRVVQLPECALSTPDADGCVGTSVATRNDGSGRLTADVSAEPTGSLFAVRAAADGPAGDFKASSLSPSASWSVGSSSGDFNWSYPMDVPPGVGGLRAQLSLGYNSSSVDGRTVGTNNQPSWAGEGFDFTPGGSIERRYTACGSEKDGNNGKKPTGDLCWGTDNASFSLNGKGGELVRDDETGQWHPKNDDGSTVERLTGAPNGDDDGEHWRITTTDGTKYYFGLNRLPGWDEDNEQTDSAWTVPVFGNHDGEPCHKAKFGDSWCQQAWRWNLDYVVDRHGNTMSLFYDTETNNYARNMTATAVSTYVRAGNVARIEYGQRDGEVYNKPAVARVLFHTEERCIPGGECTTDKPETYPDTPLDQACDSTTNCKNKYSPSFWTRKRLDKVTTQVWRGAEFEDVESWTLRHTFPDPGDGTRPRLWLEAITNTGHVGGNATETETSFDGVQLANRVDGIDGIPAMNWWRVSAVHYGSGGELAVTYSGPDCKSPEDVPSPDTNGRRCYPVRWTPQGGAERQDLFHKYVVTVVTESDRVSGLQPVVTEVEYQGPAAWHFDEEDGLVSSDRKTWAQWRGYERVRVVKGHRSGKQSVTEQRFFRGMDGDKLASGGHKDASIEDSTGGKAKDNPTLTGKVRERITWADGAITDRSITDQWISEPTATRVRPWGTTHAFKTHDLALRQDQAVDGGWRQTGSRNTYTPTGALESATDLNNLADPSDDICTRYEYTTNPEVGLAELKVRQQTVSVACGKPWTKEQVISDERIYYDNSTTPGGVPTQGNPTRIDRIAEFDAAGNPVYETRMTAKFDAAGRQIEATNALGKTTKTEYFPAENEPVTKQVVTQPNGHQQVTELDPAWGTETVYVDEGGRRTEAVYDPLGRTTKVWKPGRSRDDKPDVEYNYLVRSDGPNVVSTKTLQSDGSIETEHELFDGLMRSRQTQKPAPGGGRVMVDHIYDSRGLEVKQNGPYWNNAAPGTDVLLPNEAELPTQKVTEYDAAERPTAEILLSLGVEKWRTKHSHAAGRHTVEPPEGETPTTRITNVEGQVTELWQHTGKTGPGNYDKTFYTYNPNGKLASVADPAGNKWRFQYDLRGRKIRDEDPDKGVTTYTYNALDQLVTSTDSRGVTLAHTYDEIGRKTAVHEGSTQGTKRAEWAYDTPAKGLPTSSTRWINGKAYSSRVTEYDGGGRPLSTELTIPDSEGKLAGTYRFASTYHVDGELKSSQLPGVGDLPAETLTYGYNAQDLPTTMGSNLGSYVTETRYTPFGQVQQVTLQHKKDGQSAYHLFDYDLATRRLTKVLTERDISPMKVTDVAYEYDAAGNVKKVTDTPSSQSGEPADAQCFNYDYLRRLTTAWTPGDANCAAEPSAQKLGGPAPYWHSWTFDKTGNRTSEKKVTPAASIESTYEYAAPGQAKPHALRKVTTKSASGNAENTYDYDEVGNLKKRTLAGAGEEFAWDAEGHLEQVTKDGKTTSFVYDAEGNRLLRRDGSGTTLYLGETEVLLQPNDTLTGTRHYQHAGQSTAVRTGGKLTWLGADHHGTNHIAIDAETQQVQRRRSDPFGNPRGAAPSAWPGQRGFVGGTQDSSTGLTHLGAREYDPTTGRFISVDPVADFDDPQQLNSYSYANNNPVTLSDPDGKLAMTAVVTYQVQMVPVTERISRTVQDIVRTVESVTSTYTTQERSWYWDLFGLLKSFVKTIVHTVTKLVEKFITVVKTVVETVTKYVKKVTRVVKYVAAKVKQQVKKAASQVMQGGAKLKKWAPKNLEEAKKMAWRNRGKIASVVAGVGCVVPGVGWASCALLQAGALTVRMDQRATEGGGWKATARENIGDALITTATMGIIKIPIANWKYGKIGWWHSKNANGTRFTSSWVKTFGEGAPGAAYRNKVYKLFTNVPSLERAQSMDRRY